MKKLRSQHYLLLTLSILTFFAAISAFVFMYKDSIKKAEEEAALKEEILAASRKVVESSNIETVYKETSANRSILPSFLVSLDNAVPFIDAVEAVGPASGDEVSISSLSSGIDSSSSHQVVTASVSISGTWPNTMRAIEMIENLPYAVSVKNLSLEDSNADSSTGKSPSRWTASLELSVLSLP